MAWLTSPRVNGYEKRIDIYRTNDMVREIQKKTGINKAYELFELFLGSYNEKEFK